MAINFRNYTNQAGITKDYYLVRDFLIKLGYCEYTYVRWDWMATHGYLDKSALANIGIWMENNEIVGVATFDCSLGKGFCLTLPDYAYLKKEMLLYSEGKLSKQGSFEIVIQDKDIVFQEIASKFNYVATENRELDSIFYLDQTPTDYQLPEGFHITTMQETFDIKQYRSVLWKGFNHERDGEGEFKFTKEMEQQGKEEMLRPNVELDLKVAVVAPNGNFVSYCGMWFDKEARYAVIEPVATDPQYRRMGLGKAAVLEGIRRVGEKGAKIALVGSSQQFYYSIGLRPYSSSTIWRKKR